MTATVSRKRVISNPLLQGETVKGTEMISAFSVTSSRDPKRHCNNCKGKYNLQKTMIHGLEPLGEL